MTVHQIGSSPDVQLRVSARLWDDVQSHMFPGDNYEHGGVLMCGTTSGARGTRLLAREFRPALEGVDYVPGTTGLRALTAAFTLDAALRAAETKLVPLFIHCHGSGDTVAFSSIDLDSHERGYPALIAISGTMVGALVVAERAVAGDVWHLDGRRSAVSGTVVVGDAVVEFKPRTTRPRRFGPDQDREARLFGDQGLEILRKSRVAVLGVGGIGMLAVEWLSMLGVGTLVVVDPKKVTTQNRNRLPGARRWDARENSATSLLPKPVRRMLSRQATAKVNVARRIATRAGMGTEVERIPLSLNHPAAISAIKDCDFILLAADSNVARYVANYVSHQFLIPMVQAGTKVVVTHDGTIGEIFAVVRFVTPDAGCLQCAELISSERLALEFASSGPDAANDYGTGQPAPSVVVLNAIAASHAVGRMQLSMTRLSGTPEGDCAIFHPTTESSSTGTSAKNTDCRICGDEGVKSFGDLKPLRIPPPNVMTWTLGRGFIRRLTGKILGITGVRRP